MKLLQIESFFTSGTGSLASTAFFFPKPVFPAFEQRLRHLKASQKTSQEASQKTSKGFGITLAVLAMDNSSQAPSAAGFFPGKFTQGDRDGRHEASGIRNMTAYNPEMKSRTMRTRTAIMVSKRRSPKRNRTGRASPFLSALILEGIALLAIIAIARPDLIQTLLVRWNPQPTQLQNSFESPYPSNLAIDRPGVFMTQGALGR